MDLKKTTVVYTLKMIFEKIYFMREPKLFMLINLGLYYSYSTFAFKLKTAPVGTGKKKAQ